MEINKMLNKKNKKDFVKKPEFIVINNIYDELYRLTDKYGFEQVIMHLGEVARKQVSRDLASRIWGALKLENRIKNLDN